MSLTALAHNHPLSSAAKLNIFIVSLIFEITIFSPIVQVMFESEEAHFYTGDLSDSAALLVKMMIL